MIYTQTIINKNEKIDINIKLNDPFNNGHEDFVITGFGSEKIANGKYIETFCGSAHNEIKRFTNKFNLFIDLHNCDAKGYAMFLADNLMFLLNENEDKESIIKIYTLNEELYTTFKKAAQTKDMLYFKYVIENTTYLKDCNRRANQAIEKLEKLTNCKYIDNSTRYNYTFLTAQEKESIITKIENNEYSQKNILNKQKNA